VDTPKLAQQSVDGRRLLQDKLVMLFVGPEQVYFTIHEGILESVPILTKQLEECRDGCQLVLPNESPEVVSRILKFLYTGVFDLNVTIASGDPVMLEKYIYIDLENPSTCTTMVATDDIRENLTVRFDDQRSLFLVERTEVHAVLCEASDSDAFHLNQIGHVILGEDDSLRVELRPGRRSYTKDPIALEFSDPSGVKSFLQLLALQKSEPVFVHLVTK